jgi:hypothetical protein
MELHWQNGKDMVPTRLREGGELIAVLGDEGHPWRKAVEKDRDGYWYRNAISTLDAIPEYFGPFDTVGEAKDVALTTYRMGV